jgi:hypothetical protein
MGFTVSGRVLDSFISLFLFFFKRGNMANKIFGKINEFRNYFDLLTHAVSDFFHKKYNIMKLPHEIKREAIKTLFLIKREVLRTFVEALFLVTGLLAIIIGILLLLSKYFPLEYILIFYGLIISIIVLLKLKLRV